MDANEIAIKLQETTDRSLRNEGRIKKLEEGHEAINKMATSVAVMAEKMENMAVSVNNLSSKVDEMESKPAKRWDGMVDKIIFALAGAFLAWLVSGASGL